MKKIDEEVGICGSTQFYQFTNGKWHSKMMGKSIIHYGISNIFHKAEITGSNPVSHIRNISYFYNELD
jgi:hypothetical protein